MVDRVIPSEARDRPAPARSLACQLHAMTSPTHPLADEIRHLVHRHPLLLHRVPVPDRHRPARDRLPVHRDAERRARLVHPAVAPADGAAVVVEGRESALEVVVERGGQLGHPVLLHQREDARLDRRHGRVEAQHHPGLPLDLLLPVGVHQQGEGDPVRPGRRLDDVRQEALVGRLLEVVELLAGVLLVPAEVEVAAVVDALDLLPAEGELVLHVEGGPGVVRQLVGAVLVPAEPGRGRGPGRGATASATPASARTTRRRSPASRRTASPSARTRGSGR